MYYTGLLFFQKSVLGAEALLQNVLKISSL